METWATKIGFFKCPVPKEKVTVPGLGDVWVYGLLSGEKDEYENSVVEVKAGSRQVKLTNARAVLMQRTIYDQHGKLMFGEDDIGRLCCVPAKVADPILDVARRLSGMRSDELDDLVKNSGTDPAPTSGGSGSDSPDTSVSPKPK